MGTLSHYDRREPRAPFAPDENQQRLLDAVKDAHMRAAEAEAEYRRLLAECADADIPVATLAKTIGTERKSIYRHLGRSMS